MLMSEMVRSGAQAFAARTAICFADRVLTFSEAEAWANRLANGLISTGRAPVGARIALLLNNGLFSIPLDFACAAARVTRVPLNARLSAREHAQMIVGAGADLLVFGPDLAERAHELAALVPGLELLCLGEGGGAHDLLKIARGQSDLPFWVRGEWRGCCRGSCRGTTARRSKSGRRRR